MLVYRRVINIELVNQELGLPKRTSNANVQSGLLQELHRCRKLTQFPPRHLGSEKLKAVEGSEIRRRKPGVEPARLTVETQRRTFTRPK